MNRRWYDQQPNCVHLIEQIKSMPQAEMRDFSAKVLIHVAEKLKKNVYQRSKTIAEVNSLGREALQGLYRYGEERRRWYDQEAAVHKSVGLFYTLNADGLYILGDKLGDTLGLIAIYAQVCEQLQQAPNTKEIANITLMALKTGRQEAEELLISVIGKERYLTFKTTQ